MSESDDCISNEQLERVLISRVKPLDWLLISDILNDRADEIQRGIMSSTRPTSIQMNSRTTIQKHCALLLLPQKKSRTAALDCTMGSPEKGIKSSWI